jgi:hypothetical protein
VLELNTDLSAWTLKHRPTLGRAMLASFNLPTNPKAHENFVFCVNMRHLPRERNEAKRFLVEDVYQVPLERLLQEDPTYWGDLVRNMKGYDELEEDLPKKKHGTGCMALRVNTGVQVIARQLLMTFYVDGAAKTPDPDWERNFRRDVAEGILY